MSDDVLISIDGSAGRISLNRPKALHALTLEMCHAMSAALTGWEHDEAVHAVVIDHAEGRGRPREDEARRERPDHRIDVAGGILVRRTRRRRSDQRDRAERKGRPQRSHTEDNEGERPYLL